MFARTISDNTRWRVIGHLCKTCTQECSNRYGPLLLEQLSARTGIRSNDLRAFNPQTTTVSVAQRMSWASTRETTRVEDEAYSLLGIFDVNMPLIYGEGRKAFQRLQEEIVRRSRDQSIFAWRLPGSVSSHPTVGLFAPTPRLFQLSERVEAAGHSVETEPFSLTNHGIQFKTRLRKDQQRQEPYFIMELNCNVVRAEDEGAHTVCLTLQLVARSKASKPYAGTNIVSWTEYVRVLPYDFGERYEGRELREKFNVRGSSERLYIPASFTLPPSLRITDR